MNNIAIKNTENYMTLDYDIVETMLEPYKFTAEEHTEEDGSVILCLNEIKFLIETGATREEAIKNLAAEILDFSKDYFNDLKFWARGNGKAHVPYLLKALMLNDVEKIGGLITCRLGEI